MSDADRAFHRAGLTGDKTNPPLLAWKQQEPIGDDGLAPAALDERLALVLE